MNQYAKLKNRQQKEFNALPLGFAFSNKQFDEMMQNWRLDPKKDIDKIYSLGHGSYIQKNDADLFHKTCECHDRELKEAIAADKTGDGFIYEMFLYELYNHEYGYTSDPEDALDALGYTWEEVEADARLLRGFKKAHKKIMRDF